MTDGKDKAFPGEWQKNSLTKREYLASMAMQGLLSSFTEKASIGAWGTELEETAEASVRAADALINALNQQQNG